jgi:hypothetical protein
VNAHFFGLPSPIQNHAKRTLAYYLITDRFDFSRLLDSNLVS